MTSVMNQKVQTALKDNQRKHDSWSLFFDKFSGYSPKKEPILEKVCSCYADNNSQKFMQAAVSKKYAQFQQLARMKKMRFVYLQNRSRLLVNMGHSCVLENVGFSFERISGLPYVPGSSLKGVVSNWALWEANGDAAFEEGLPNFSKNRTELNRQLVDIFGANEGDAEQGKINFYGISPLEVPKLEIDILTPHGGRIIPNHFLAVKSGCHWMIPIALNRGDETLLDQAERLIETCLNNYGVGAKTASGYGKFETPIKADLDKCLGVLQESCEEQQAQLKAFAEAVEKAGQEEEVRKKAEEEEVKRWDNLTPEEKLDEKHENAAVDYKNALPQADLAGAFKGKVGQIASLQEDEQRSICLLLKGSFNSIWQDSLIEAAKAEKQSEKKRAKNKGLKRANAVRPIAEKLGVEL